MDITYERKHNESYMILDGKKISALLEMTSIAIDENNRISYRISRKENLEDFVEANDLTPQLISKIVINLQIALDEINRFLIDEQHLLLDKETIYVDKGEGFRLSLCYFPGSHGTVQQQFRGLMEFFLGKSSFSDRDMARELYTAYDSHIKKYIALKI